MAVAAPAAQTRLEPALFMLALFLLALFLLALFTWSR